jgi:hypothetical protein
VEGEPVLSANRCEGSLAMTPEEGGATLTADVRWERTLRPAGPPLPGSVRLWREDFAGTEALAQRLRPAYGQK